LNRSVLDCVRYTIRLEPGIQTPEETLEKRSGSCRDSAWLLVQLCRHLGLAARFCSGYLIQLVSDEKPIEGPEGPTADFTDLHAWTEVYVPGAGWIGLDPTSGLLTAEGHIPLACSADPQSASPVEGTYGWFKKPDVEDDKVEEQFIHEMYVTRLNEKPRVTKPYTEEQWQSIDALGRYVDRDLTEWDVRLTMGGEPTFVGIDDRDAAEWNTEALGPTKRMRAAELLHRLRDRFSNGGFLHFGQGKWYPGESLPRWAFNCYWRRDGQPIWHDLKWVADEKIDYGYTASDAKRFIVELAKILDVDGRHAQAGYEDAWYYMWRERRLPTNVDPLKSKLEDPEERARIARVFEQMLGSIVGYALPLRRNHSGTPRWESGEWFLRKENLFLFPGDSPMGFRLPIDSLPWEAESTRQFLEPLDPFATRPALPNGRRTLGSPLAPMQPSMQPQTIDPALGSRASNGRGTSPFPAAPNDIDALTNRRRTSWSANNGDPNEYYDIVRTALCVEPRNGVMYVFMPPARFLEDYIDLVEAIEETAAKLSMPVMIEGYRPPSDHARPRSHRSQHSSIGELEADRRTHARRLRRSSAIAAFDGKIHARRSAHGYGWR
jgi:hypothetical protein